MACRNFRGGALLFLLLVSLAGCVSPGQRLEPAAVKQLHAGQTRAEVRRIFGEPRATLHGSDRQTLEGFIYWFDKPRFVLISNHDGDLVVRHLDVLYGANDLVQKFQFSESAIAYDDRFTGYQLGKELAERAGFIQRKATTRKELVDRLGPPAVTGLTVAGNPLLSWWFISQQAFRDSHRQELLVKLDAADLVDDFTIADREF